MRPGALDLECLFDRLLDAHTLQQGADRLDQRRWQVREIGGTRPRARALAPVAINFNLIFHDVSALRSVKFLTCIMKSRVAAVFECRRR
jgi:hypothetical protein